MREVWFLNDDSQVIWHVVFFMCNSLLCTAGKLLISMVAISRLYLPNSKGGEDLRQMSLRLSLRP